MFFLGLHGKTFSNKVKKFVFSMATYMLIHLVNVVSAFMEGVTTLRGFQDKVTECTPGKVGARFPLHPLFMNLE